MFVKKRIPSLCKLYSFFEETSEEFLDETKVDIFIYDINFDISSPSIELFELAEAPKRYHLQSSFSRFAI